jgi:hypothetical protein
VSPAEDSQLCLAFLVLRVAYFGALHLDRASYSWHSGHALRLARGVSAKSTPTKIPDFVFCHRSSAASKHRPWASDENGNSSRVADRLVTRLAPDVESVAEKHHSWQNFATRGSRIDGDPGCSFSATSLRRNVLSWNSHSPRRLA